MQLTRQAEPLIARMPSQGSRSGALRCLVRCGSAAAHLPPAEPKLRALATLAGSDLRFGAAGAWAA